MPRLIVHLTAFSCCLLLAYNSFSQSLPPLLTAIKNNDTAQVNLLLKSGADISIVDGATA